MSNIVKPSLSFLPMEDIAAELRSEKDNRRFMTKDDKASDVENVSGASSNTIAIAVSATQRTTIDNALHLAGIPAENYLSKSEGDKIVGISNVMSEVYSSEIRNLRDESLQLSTQLVKNGFINNALSYEGFGDAFKRSDIKYEGFVCGISKAIIGNTEELFIGDISKKRFFEAGKKFAIKRVDLETEIVVTSSGITESGKVTFYPTVNILDSIETVELHKSTGEYVRDSFSFSQNKKNVANSLKERYHMQSDDTRTSLQIINRSNTGYAVYFKVPNNASGALTKFAVRGKAEGTPGSLICHMLKKDSIMNSTNEFRVDFSNIEDAKAKGYWIASSQPIQSSAASTEQELFFNFFDIANNKYPIVEGTQYLFIIECLAATEFDFWTLRFSYYEEGNESHADLQKYNNSYFYEKLPTTESVDKPISIINNIDKYDMIFSLVTRELIEEDEIGKQEGVYTANIVLPQPINVSRMRLTSRINREGCYFAESYNNTYTIFTLAKESTTSHPVADMRFNIDDTIIIGNQIAKVKRVTGNQVETASPVYIDKRMLKFYSKKVFNADTQEYTTETKIPVYRMNYNVYVKPSLINWNVWDNVNKEFVTTDIAPLPIKLELKNVIPDGKKENKRISDRLLFECSFGKEVNDIAKNANEFELQIHWRSPFSYNEINDFKDLNDNNFKELIGRAHDIILTFDKNY